VKGSFLQNFAKIINKIFYNEVDASRVGKTNIVNNLIKKWEKLEL
jgi:hypothetical protein